VATPTEVGCVAFAEAVGPNATLLEGDIEAAICGLKARIAGEIVAGPGLAQSLTDVGLIGGYRLIFPPVRVWSRHAILRGPRPALRLVAGEDAFRLTYVPA
jgi:hypothetical protein